MAFYRSSNFQLANSEFADVVELRRLLALTTREAVRGILQDALTRFESELPADRAATISAPPEPISTASTSATAVAAAPSGLVPLAVTAPVKPVVYNPITSWGWEQNKEFVEVLLISGINGVGSLPKEAISVDFTTSSFDLKIHGLNGSNYRLRVTNLDKDIVPAKSRIEVKKNRVSIWLKKAGEYDHWMDLVAKKLRSADKEKEGKKAADPSAGIMDMMREMYESGDDATRKVIGEAWTKSRETQKGGGALGGGMGMGMGGKGMGLGDDFDM